MSKHETVVAKENGQTTKKKLYAGGDTVTSAMVIRKGAVKIAPDAPPTGGVNVIIYISESIKMLF
jgi:hypothetical protein